MFPSSEYKLKALTIDLVVVDSIYTYTLSGWDRDGAWGGIRY